MKGEVDLLALCWKLATIFGSVSTNKAFHIWVVMFTYLALAGAWLYYRRQADNDERDEANVSDTSKDLEGRCECKDELEQSELEDDLTDVIPILNEDICSDDCIEQVPRSEQETQTDRISVAVHVRTSKTKEAGCGFVSNKPVDPAETTKNTQVNNACDLPSSHELEEYCRIEKINFDRSQEKDDSLAAAIQDLTSNDNKTPSELKAGLSRKSVHKDNEGCTVYEIELEIGFRPSDNVSGSIELPCSENEEVTTKRTLHVSDDSIRKRKLAKPAQKKRNDEKLMKSNIKNTNLLPVYEKDKAFSDYISPPKNQGEKIECCKDAEEEGASHISNIEGESDIKIASLNLSDSTCDLVQNNGHDDPPLAYNVAGHVSDVMEATEGNLSPYEAPSGEIIYRNGSVLGSQMSAHLESSENMNSSLDNSKLCNPEEKNGGHCEFEHKESLSSDNDNEQSVNRFAPATAKDNKCFSDVNGSFCKQFTHIINAAEIQTISILPNEAESILNASEYETGNPPDRQYEMSDRCDKRAKAVVDDTMKQLECLEIVELPMAAPTFCNEICKERSEANNYLDVDYGQGKVSTLHHEITDESSNLSAKSFDIGHDTKGLLDATHPITLINCELLDENNESYSETLMDDLKKSIENEATILHHQPSDNLHEVISMDGELEEKVNNSEEINVQEAPEARILKGSFREEYENAYRYRKCKSENYCSEEELNRSYRTDEERKDMKKVKKTSVEENQGKICDEEVCSVTKIYDIETCSSSDNSLFTCKGKLKHQEGNSRASIKNPHTEEEDMKWDDDIKKYSEENIGNTDISLDAKILSHRFVFEYEEDFSQKKSNEKDAFASSIEHETVADSAVAYDDIAYQSDELSDKRTDDAPLLSSVFNGEFNISSRNSLGDAQEEITEALFEGEQSVAFSNKENYITNFDRGERDVSEKAAFDLDWKVRNTEMLCCEKDYESEESTESCKDIDYELLVSSGTESADVSDDDRFNQWINEYESEEIHLRTNDNINALDTISELEEIGFDEEICVKTSATAVEDFFQQGNEGLCRDVCLQVECSNQIQLNRRESALSLTFYPKNARFLHYFGNLLLNPSVFVDVFDNVPLQLVFAINNADRIIELSTKKLSARSHFGLSVASRDPYFARNICEIARDIDYYFSRFIKDCECRQRRAILPGHFGISFQKKAHCCEFEKLSPIVCDPIPTLDVDTMCVDEDNTLSHDVVHPAICCAGFNEFDSNEIFRTKPTETFDCKGDVNGEDFLTTLAAVHNGKFSENGSSWAGISNYLEGGATALFGLDALKTESKYEEFPTDAASQTRQLERVASIEFHEEVEKNRLCSVVPDNELVGQYNFDSPFEQEYTLSSNENHHTSCESDRAKKLNFDLLFSKPQSSADFTSEEVSPINCESTPIQEKDSQEFETEDKVVDQSSTLEMGQVQSVVFTKGTLAMPVSNYSLRGISVRNQGEYAVINKKNTRLAPLVSVDKRIQITMRMPKQNEILPDRNTQHIVFKNKKNSNLPSKKDVDSEANKPINVEVLSEFMKHSIVGGECEKKCEGSSIGDEHNSSSKSHSHKVIETVHVDESPTTFSIGYDKIAEIAQNFGIVSNTECVVDRSGSKQLFVPSEEQRDVPTSVCTVYIDSEHRATTENPCMKDIVENHTAKDESLYHEHETAANDLYFEAPIVTVDSSTLKDYGVNNELRIIVNPSCFGDFGVTNPSTEREQIHSVDDNDFQDAVNSHEELSATDNHYKCSLLLADKSFDRGQNVLPQKVGFDSFQTKVEIESTSTDVEVRKDNESFIESEGTVHLISRSKHNRVRSKSLTSLPEGLFENMSWFYRDRPSSVCFDNKTLKASAYGALRRTKSAEISRRKPKIRMSTNFERRPIKETNLDELIKSLEYLGPLKEEKLGARKEERLLDTEQEITDATSPRGKEAVGKGIVTISKADNETMLLSQRKYDELKGREAVSKLVEKFESPSKATRKIVVETKHIIKHEPQQRSTMSANTDKNVKHLYEANKIVGSLDNNNNNNNRLDQRNKTLSIETADIPASFGVCEPREQRFSTNVKENSTKNFSLKQHQDTKKELHAALNADIEDKENQLVGIQCSSEDRPSITCSEEWNEITNTKRQLTGNVTEYKADDLHDCNEKVIPFTDVNISDKETSELESLANEKNAQRTSAYGFTVFLSESHQSDSLELTPERDVGVLKSPQQEHFWLQQRNCPDVDGNCNEKVSDIDLVLKTTFQTSVENLEKLNASNTACSGCSNVIENKVNSATGKCDECTESLQQYKSRDKPRSRNSFRKDKRLRKWLEVRQSSMNSEEKLALNSMDADDQSKLLRKIALSKGIEYKEDGEDEIKKKRHFSLRSRQFDFLEQLRYLINFEDDDYDENIKNLEVNEKEHDAIELLREYEINRQLKKGKSPFTSEDEGNDSDAFTDITDTTFSDYTRSRHSLNSLLLSQGSLNRSGSLDLVENDHNHESLDKEISRKSTDIIDASVSNSIPQRESYFGQSAPLNEEKNIEKNAIIEKNVEEDLHVVSTPKLSHKPDIIESIDEVSAVELFSTYDVNGLISQGNSAIRNRRGRTSKLNASRPAVNLWPSAETRAGVEPLGQSANMNFDHVFIDNPEANIITKNIVDIHRPLAQTSIKRNKLTESYIYADSPCSLLTERLNDASYENLRVKLVNKSNTLPKVSPTHLRKDIDSRSPYHSPHGGSLRSPVIRTLNNSPQHTRRAISLREMSTDRKTSSLKSRSFHSVPTSPPRHFRELSSRKSNRDYDQHTIGQSLPDLIAKPDGSLVSPIKSLYSSGGSSTLSLQQRSPRLQQASPHRYSAQFPIRSPVRSPRFSECEDELADTETVFSDHTAFFSDSSIDFGYEVDDEDFFLPNSKLDANFSKNVDDFLSHESDGASSGEYFVPLNTRSKRPESRVISCAFGPCKNKDYVDWSQRSQFTSCVSCFTYYCSKECRKAHWNEHKLSCFYGRIIYYMNALVRRFETRKDVNEKLSRMALEGFRESGRGCVLVSFSSPMAAKFFLSTGTNSFVNSPSYATLNEVLNDGIVTKHQVLLQQTLLDYNPEIEFVVNLTVFVGKQNEFQASTRSRFNSSSLLRCSKIPLNGIFLSHELEPYPETSYEIKVFYLPKSKSHHFINETEARRYYCREVSYGLRKYGVVLKRDYPDAYDKLCLYVEHNVEFLPITLYGQSNGKNYKCVVFPEEFSGSSGTLELQGRGMLV